jgi:hypothetical protein
MLIGAAASAALFGGIAGAALTTAATTGTSAATAIEYGAAPAVPVCYPTAVEYALNEC